MVYFPPYVLYSSTTANICIFPKVNRGWQIYFGTEESAVKHVDYPGTVCLHFYFCFGTSHIIVICHINIHIDVSVYGNNSQISPPDAMCFVLYCTEYFPYSTVRLPSRKIKVGNNGGQVEA